MTGAILYKGRYGATEQYSRWLADELAMPALDIDKVSAEMLAHYDFIIAGASVYMGKMQNKRWLHRYSNLLKSKKLFLFVVCGTPKNQREKLNTILETNIPPVLLDRFDIFFLQGRMIMSKLSWIDRLMLKMGARLEKDPNTKKAMLRDFDAVKKENIYSLLDAVNAYRKKTVYATEH